MKAEIITIGDEILIGQIVDTNSQWIGQEFNKIGVSVYQITSIQDDREHILNALNEAENRADIVIITGGLGPTKDDITKKTLGEYFNDDKLVYYPEAMKNIEELFAKLGREVKPIQRCQAEIPSKATMLFNHYGTAPGMWFNENDTIFVSLPGVPYEMKGLITNKVIPRIQKEFNLPFIKHTTIHTFGTGETTIAEILSDFEENLPDFVKLAYLPSARKVRLRLSGEHTDKAILENTINNLTSEIQRCIPEIISGVGDKHGLEKQIGILLKEKGKTICTAESMTGGKIASTIVSVAGASTYFKGSLITYSTELKKELLDISAQLVEKHSVVSKEVAEVMAITVRKKLHTDYAISVTGNAGPTTDYNDKEVGLVYIGIASEGKTEVYEFNFGQPREKVINRTITKALELVQKTILKP